MLLFTTRLVCVPVLCATVCFGTCLPPCGFKYTETLVTKPGHGEFPFSAETRGITSSREPNLPGGG